MSKLEVVAAHKEMILSSIDTALGACYDAGFAEAGVAPAVSQTDIDKAVAEVKAVDAQALMEAQAKASSELMDLQAKFDTLGAKEAMEAQEVLSFSSAIVSLQASVDAIKLLIK